MANMTHNSSDSRELRGDLPKKARKSLRKAQADLGRFGHDMGELADTVGKDARKRARRMAHNAQAAFSTVRGRIQERPAVAIGVVATAGVLLGLLLASRR